MNTFIVHPHTEAQEKAVKAILEALNVDFIIEDDESLPLPANVIAQIKKSEAEIAGGQFYTHEEVMKEYRRYL